MHQLSTTVEKVTQQSNSSSMYYDRNSNQVREVLTKSGFPR